MIIKDAAINSPSDVMHCRGFYGEYFCYSKIFQEFLLRIKLMTLKHDKVLIQKFDLMFPHDYNRDVNNEYDGRNKEISEFFRVLKEHVYSYGIDIQYVWVRDQAEPFLVQHYHCMILLNAGITDNSVSGNLSLLWSRVLDASIQGIVRYINNECADNTAGNGIIIRRPSSSAKGEELRQQKMEFDYILETCFIWAYDMAKINSKCQTPKHIKRYGVSRIPTKDVAEYLMDRGKLYWA